MLDVVLLNVVMLDVVLLNVVMLSVVMLNVDILVVMEPFYSSASLLFWASPLSFSFKVSGPSLMKQISMIIHTLFKTKTILGSMLETFYGGYNYYSIASW
jgi:hypothetical protein